MSLYKPSKTKKKNPNAISTVYFVGACIVICWILIMFFLIRISVREVQENVNVEVKVQHHQSIIMNVSDRKALRRDGINEEEKLPLSEISFETYRTPKRKKKGRKTHILRLSSTTQSLELVDTIESNYRHKYYFLHVGKTGGTYVREQISNSFMAATIDNIPHRPMSEHPDVPLNRTIAFVRDPVDRWVSSFMSKKRMGCPSHFPQPRLDDAELFMFHKYPTPNDLAEALDDPIARAAMLHSAHMSKTLSYYLDRGNPSEMFYIGRMEHMEEDLDELANEMANRGYQRGKQFKQDGQKLHVNTYFEGTRLSEKGHCNVERLLQNDYDLLDRLWKDGKIETRYERKCKKLSKYDMPTFFSAPVGYSCRAHIVKTCDQVDEYIRNGTLFAPISKKKMNELANSPKANSTSPILKNDNNSFNVTTTVGTI